MPYSTAAARPKPNKTVYIPSSYSLKVLAVSGLVAYWPLDEIVGATANDITGQGRNGRSGNVTLGNTGIGDGRTAPSFNGTSSYITCLTTALTGAFNGAEGSIMCWAQVSGAGVWADAAQRRVLYFFADNNNRVHVTKETTASRLGLYYMAGGVTKNFLITTSSTAWQQFVVTWSKAADQVKLYMNGTQQSTTLTGLGTWVGPLTGPVIGAGSTGGIGVFSGNVAHVAVWNRALTAAEVTTLAAV